MGETGHDDGIVENVCVPHDVGNGRVAKTLSVLGYDSVTAIGGPPCPRDISRLILGGIDPKAEAHDVSGLDGVFGKKSVGLPEVIVPRNGERIYADSSDEGTAINGDPHSAHT